MHAHSVCSSPRDYRIALLRDSLLTSHTASPSFLLLARGHAHFVSLCIPFSSHCTILLLLVVQGKPVPRQLPHRLRRLCEYDLQRRAVPRWRWCRPIHCTPPPAPQSEQSNPKEVSMPGPHLCFAHAHPPLSLPAADCTIAVLRSRPRCRSVTQTWLL
jgi:hypothetical protein